MSGDGFIDFLDREFGRGLSVSFMANQVPQRTNRIELHPTVKDKWGRPVAYIIKNWHPHDIYLMNIFAEQCGNILRYGGDAVNRNYPIEGQGRSTRPRTRWRGWPTTSWAAPGSAPIRNDSVLDPDCRAWEFDNLYVTDGSFMPTSGGANPTMTIQANSFRVADHLLRGFRRTMDPRFDQRFSDLHESGERDLQDRLLPGPDLPRRST